ncbi:MAG: outer membrane protein assembly factor BamB [Rhodocyclaceae bacterium]|nr:outer membrane protein assembly factor BamB [Rhodocyclaceae bacterium]
MKKCYSVLLAAAVLMSAGCSTLDDLNPFSGKTKAKVGKLAELPLGGDFKYTWKQSTGSSGVYVFSPAVHEKSVFSASSDGSVQRIENGSAVWKITLKEKLSAGVGTDGARVAVGTPKGEVVVLDAKSGIELWRAKASSEILAAPVVAEGLVVARSGDSRIYAYEGADGKRRWVYQRTTPTLTLRSNVGVAVKGDKTFAGLPGGKLVALSNVNGAAMWEATVALPRGATELERVTDITSEPAISGAVVCAVAFQGKLACFDRVSGNAIWSRDVSSSVGIDADASAVYVSDDKGSVHSFALPTGASVWKQESLQGRGVGRPLVLGKRISVSDNQGYIHFMDSGDGSIVARGSTDSSGVRSAMSRSDSGLVAQTTDGAVYAFSSN